MNQIEGVRLYLTSRARRKEFFKSMKQSRRSHRDHVELLSALRKRDFETGEKILQKHLASVGKFWSERLQNDPNEEVI